MKRSRETHAESLETEPKLNEAVKTGVGLTLTMNPFPYSNYSTSGHYVFNNRQLHSRKARKVV